MRQRLLLRAERIAKAAQRRRLEQIASMIDARGAEVDVGTESVTVRGKRFVEQWLSDPLLRFAGRVRS